MKMLRVPAMAGLLLASPLCMAQGYIGASGVASEYSDYGNIGHGYGGKAYVGYRYNWFMAEAAYLDTGKSKVDGSPVNTQLGFSGVNGSLGYFARLSDTGSGVWGKVGYYSGDAKMKDVTGSIKSNSSGFSYGLGGDWMLTSAIGLRAEIEGLQSVKDFYGTPTSNHKSDITVASLGVVIGFGAPAQKPAPMSAPIAAAPASAPPPAAAAPVAAAVAPPSPAAVAPAVPAAPVVAAAAAPAPRPSVQRAGAPTAQARVGAMLRDQPTPNGPVAQVMPSGGAVDLLQRVYNTTGGWWYVRTVKGSGWINENELWLNTQ